MWSVATMADPKTETLTCTRCGSTTGHLHLFEGRDGEFCRACAVEMLAPGKTRTLADEFAAAVDTLRRAAESARRNGHLTGDTLLRQLADPVADWLESWQGVHLSVGGPMSQDYEHALKIVRIVNGSEHA
jgi:hypothetical protein